MDFFLCTAAFFAFYAGHPASALLLRCGLAACARFSPRAALALAAVASFSGASAGLLCRGGLGAAASGQRGLCAACGFAGGVMGRALLLMLTARFPSSTALARVQGIPLLLLFLLSLLPPRRQARLPLTPLRLAGYALLCAGIDGFFGAGSIPLFALAALGGVRRRRDLPAGALLTTLCAQTGALLLTILTGQAQIFPPRMLLWLALGAALGAASGETQKERGAFHNGMRAALKTYGILAACSCIEQAV